MSEAETRPRTQAAPDEPHWVVIALDGEGPTQNGRGHWRRLFRHPTEESANAECRRLAAITWGQRYGVYASGKSWMHIGPLPDAPE